VQGFEFAVDIPPAVGEVRELGKFGGVYIEGIHESIL
jgi:hypothetical protein